MSQVPVWEDKVTAGRRTQRFAKHQRLVSNRDIRGVLDRRRRVGDGVLVLYVGPNQCGHPRLGVSVGRAYGNSVQRNRFKRLVREAFRLSRDRLPADLDYLVLPAFRRGRRRPAPPSDYCLARIRASLLGLAARVRAGS